MGGLYDEDGIDGPFERGMDAPIRKRAVRRRRWSREEVTVRGKRFVDYVSDDVPFRYKIEQGHHEDERRAGNPYTLRFRGADVGFFPSLQAAKAAADRHAKEAADASPR